MVLSKTSELTKIPHKILEEAYKSGIEKDEESRSGTLMHVDQSTIYSKVNEAFKDKLEIMDTKQALRRYHWLED
jgi:hypothetical protein